MDAGHGCDVAKDISMRSKQQRVLPSNGAVKFSRRRRGSDLPFDKQIDHCRIGFSVEFGGKKRSGLTAEIPTDARSASAKSSHICRNQETRLGRDGVSKDMPVAAVRNYMACIALTNWD